MQSGMDLRLLLSRGFLRTNLLSGDHVSFLQQRVQRSSNFLPLFEIALVLVRFDHISSVIVNANHSVMWAAEKLCEFLAHSALPDMAE
jgi:hypothetical protein